MPIIPWNQRIAVAGGVSYIVLRDFMLSRLLCRRVGGRTYCDHAIFVCLFVVGFNMGKWLAVRMTTVLLAGFIWSVWG